MRQSVQTSNLLNINVLTIIECRAIKLFCDDKNPSTAPSRLPGLRVQFVG